MKNFTLKIVASILLASIATFVNATNYYASPDGTGSGTISDPCSFSTGKGLISSPGDTLFLRDGVYYLDSKQSITKNGSTTANICIWAYPNETPILDFRNEPYGSSYPGISIGSGSTYMHIKGLIVRYAGDNGIINQGSYCTIENCEFYGNCDTGLQHKVGGGNLILNCDSHDNFDYETGGTTAADFGGNADGFADKQYTGTISNTYKGCRSYKNADDGWDFFQKIGETEFDSCICYQNGPAEYDMTNHPRYTTDQAWFDQFPMTVTNSDGGTDYITLANYTNYGNGNGFKLGGGYTAHNVTLTNCLSVSNTVRGFDQNNNYGAMTVYNASTYDNGTNYGFGNGDGGSLVIKNSISLSSQSYDYFNCPTVTSEYNSWTISGITCDADDFISLDTTVILSDRQDDGSLASIVFMQLADGSDLIDAGTDVALAYSGTAPDLGCFELGDLDNFPGAVSSPTNKSQSVAYGSAIEDIVFTWSAGATGATASGLPDGITATVDATAKTITLSGTPTTVGVYDYTITTTGGTGDPATVTGRIVVSSADAKKIAFVTTIGSASDEPMLNKLQSNTDFSITEEDAATINDYSGYDLLVLSPAPNSSSAGLPSIEGLDKPMLLMKTFQLKDSRWNWGAASNTSEASVTVTNPSHEIFNGITLETGDELTLFSSVADNGVTVITEWYNTPTLTEIATPVTAAGQCIVEIPVGTDMDGETTTTQKTIVMGLSEYSTANLNYKGLQLIENACYYLLGMDVPTSVADASSSSDFKINQTGNTISIDADVTIESLSLYGVSGIEIAKSKSNTISTTGIPNGVYIILIESNNQTFSKKLILNR